MITVLAILAAIALVAWIITQIGLTEPARKAVWIVAAILAVLVVGQYVSPGVWRS